MPSLINTCKVQLRLYLRLGKFRLCILVLFTSSIGFALGVAQFDLVKLVCFLFGTLLSAMGANGLNQWWERDRDAQMVRTRNRPIPSGKMSPLHALLMTLGWSIVGVALLYIWVNPITAYLAIATICSYIFVYTPLKPYSSLAILAGAIPGAIPPMMGWTAATNSFGIEAVILGCLLFLWQIPHFMSLAAIYRQDYDKGGYHLLPDNPEIDMTTRSIIVVFSLALLGITMLAPAAGLGTMLFFVGAIILGGRMLSLSLKFYKRYSVDNARRVFRASIMYIPLLMTLLVIDERFVSHF